MKIWRLVYGRTTSVVAVMLLWTVVAQAGPPLICHTIEIGQAKSLPWIGHSWYLSGSETYDIKNLTRDTLELLNAKTPVLGRMETLRRATLYARKDPQVAKELLTQLHARATTGNRDALAFFDFGYLTETFKQWLGKDQPNPAAGVDGYEWVKRAIALRGQDPEMEFAAALITLKGPESQHREHVQSAIAGAKGDPLLAQNLAARFMGHRDETVSQMLAASTSPGGQWK
jgi:hypothetical protein